MTTERLIDRTIIVDADQVASLLHRMETHFRNVCEWIANNVARTAQAVIFQRLLVAAANYLHVASENVEGHASVLALATRSLYELRIRVEHMIAFPEQIDAWQAEAATDKIQLLEGILEIDTNGGHATQRAVLNQEITRIRNLLKKHDLAELNRIPNIASIAKTLGREEEHKSLFKLFSKLVHPSSYLVNDYANAASQEIYQILQIHCQLYAWDLFSRACDSLSVPEDVRSLNFPITA